MDEFSPCPTASHEITQRIDVLTARIAGYDRDEIGKAEEELAMRRSYLAADVKRLAEWQEIARRSA